MDLLDAASSYTEGNYTEAITQLSDIIGNSEDFEGTQCLKNSNNIIVDSVSAIYEQGDYETVISLVNELGSTYAENTLPTELDTLRTKAEQAASFQPVVMQDYEGFPGVLDFGAFSGKEQTGGGRGSFRYSEIDIWIVDRYISELKEKGFVQQADDPILLTSVEYGLKVTPDENNLHIEISYVMSFSQYNKIENGMTYAELVNIVGTPGILVQKEINRLIYSWVSKTGKTEMRVTFEDGVVVEKDIPSVKEGTVQRVVPSIGMTAEEVRNSTWGEPEDINRTTTDYGVYEQWVYSNYRYIYFDNGIVTAIQE